MIGMQYIGSLSVIIYIASFLISETMQEEGMQENTDYKDYERKCVLEGNPFNFPFLVFAHYLASFIYNLPVVQIVTRHGVMVHTW